MHEYSAEFHSFVGRRGGCFSRSCSISFHFARHLIRWRDFSLSSHYCTCCKKEVGKVVHTHRRGIRFYSLLYSTAANFIPSLDRAIIKVAFCFIEDFLQWVRKVIIAGGGMQRLKDFKCKCFVLEALLCTLHGGLGCNLAYLNPSNLQLPTFPGR